MYKYFFHSILLWTTFCCPLLQGSSIFAPSADPFLMAKGDRVTFVCRGTHITAPRDLVNTGVLAGLIEKAGDTPIELDLDPTLWHRVLDHLSDRGDSSGEALRSIKHILSGLGLTHKATPRINTFLVNEGGLASCVIDNHVIVAGGSMGESAVDPITGKIKEINKLPTSVVNSGHYLYQGQFYICGGLICDDRHGPCSSQTQIYNSTTDRWTTGPDLPVAIKSSSLVAHEGRLFLLGGRAHDAIEPHCTSIYTLDPREGEWKSSRHKLFRGYRLGGAISLGSRILLTGGFSGIVESQLKPHQDTFFYDPQATFEPCVAGPDLTKPRTEHQLLKLHDDSICVVGGYPDQDKRRYEYAELFSIRRCCWGSLYQNGTLWQTTAKGEHVRFHEVEAYD